MKRCQERLRIWLARSETQWLLLRNPGLSDEWVTLAWLLILVLGPTQSALLTSAEQLPIAYSLLWLHGSPSTFTMFPLTVDGTGDCGRPFPEH